jgi:hypothetical protein
MILLRFFVAAPAKRAWEGGFVFQSNFSPIVLFPAFCQCALAFLHFAV